MPVRRSTGKPVPSGTLKRIIANRNKKKAELRDGRDYKQLKEILDKMKTPDAKLQAEIDAAERRTNRISPELRKMVIQTKFDPVKFKKWAESPEGKKVIAKANAETKKIIERLKKANTFDRADLENLKRRFNI